MHVIPIVGGPIRWLRLIAIVARLFGLILFGGAVQPLAFSAPPATATSPRVLVLNSYHPGYNWSDGELKGCLRTLGERWPDVVPSVEYLDWRRFPDPARVPGLLAQLDQKYGRAPFDLIVALDDPAVAFVLEHRATLGPAVPVVFGGLNDVDPAEIGRHPAMTGVAQSYDFAGTLALVRRLQPEVRKIAAVHCRTESGLASRSALEKVIARTAPPWEFEWIEGWTAESLLDRVEKLPDDTAVLLLSIFRDEAGRVLVDDEAFGRSLAARSRVPVYFVAPPMTPHFADGAWETAVWQGMGGSLLSAELHGAHIGRLALQVLEGVPIDLIPIVEESPSRVAFDYRQLQRFGISESLLPEGAELFHAPPTFYQVHRSRIIAGVVAIVALVVLVVLLVWLILWRRWSEQERRRLATAIEQNPETVFLFEPDGTITYANPVFERVTGFPVPKNLQVAWAQVGPAGTPALEIDPIIDQVARAGTWATRLEGLRRDGKAFVLYVVVSPIRDRRGEIVSYVLVGQDVTRETKLEDQVRLSQKMEAVGMLAGGIAHDFNNLLQVINGFTSQAQEADTPEDRNECLGQVREAANRAAQLTRQLLVFSREDKAELVDLDLEEVLATQMKLLRRLLDAQVEVVLRPAPQPNNIRGDRGQLEQVFMNLCVNARDAMPRGGTITIELDEVRFDAAYCLAHPWARPGHFIQVSVTDTGTGMDRATQARIFDPFFTTKPKDKGTGLGLAIVYGIVQKHEGLLHVYSEVGVGTSFRLYFPVRPRERPVAAAPVLPELARGSGSILLAEDDESVRRLALRILERAGYAVVAAEDGELALRAYLEQGGKFDLVILDAILPKLTGREVFDQIRARDARQPVLFCSGYSAGTIQPEFSPGDAVQLLSKPFDPAELLRRVAELIAKPAG